MDVTLDELLGFISMKVFCPDDPHQNLALRALAGDIVYQANLYATRLSRKTKRYSKHFGPAGARLEAQSKQACNAKGDHLLPGRTTAGTVTCQAGTAL